MKHTIEEYEEMVLEELRLATTIDDEHRAVTQCAQMERLTYAANAQVYATLALVRATSDANLQTLLHTIVFAMRQR